MASRSVTAPSERRVTFRTPPVRPKKISERKIFGLEIFKWKFIVLALAIFAMIISLSFFVDLLVGESKQRNITHFKTLLKELKSDRNFDFTKEMFHKLFYFSIFLFVVYFCCLGFTTFGKYCWKTPPEEPAPLRVRFKPDPDNPELGEVEILTNPPAQSENETVSEELGEVEVLTSPNAQSENETVTEDLSSFTQDVTVDIHTQEPFSDQSSQEPLSDPTSRTSSVSIVSSPTSEETGIAIQTMESTCINCPTQNLDGRLVTIPGYIKDGRHFCFETNDNEDPQTSGEVRRRRPTPETPKEEGYILPRPF